MFKLIAAALVLSVIALGQQDDGVTVMKVSSLTGDSIAFQMWVRKAAYTRDENIAIDYLVQNKGRKTIYLITKKEDETRIPDSWVVEVRDPIDVPDAHYPYRYRMIKILPGKGYRGKRTVEAKKLNEHRKYSFETAEIQVGFAYMFDITGLEECSYSLPCLSKVSAEARVVNLGYLVVKRKVE